jgi:hypothetical protein
VSFDYRRFYALGEGFKRGAFRAHTLGNIPDPLALTRGEIVPSEPIRFHHDEGRRLYDLVGTTWALLKLVSDRVKSVLAENRFTGWTTYPVEIYDRRGEPVGGYNGFAVTGRCGPIDESLSSVLTLPPAVPAGEALPHRIGLRFQPEAWDGSDVFSPDGTAWAFVTEPVRDALVQAKATNLTLTRITEVEQLVLDDEPD